MKNDVDSQPKSPDLQQENEQLRRQNAKQQEQLSQLQQQLSQKDALIGHYLEQLRLLQKKQFGSSSEKNAVAPEQLSLFNEPEALADDKVTEPTVEEITYIRRKQKTTKEENLEDLVTETVEHELSGAELDCPQCGDYSS